MAVSPIPPGFRTVTPHLTIKECGKALDWYKQAFGAEEIMRMPGPDGSVMHAELKIGDSMLMFAEENPMCPTKSPKTAGCATVTIALYVADCDAAFGKATKAGGTAVMPPMDMPWGDRYGMLTDPFGVVWSIATHKEDLTPEEIGKRMEKFMSEGGCG
jgi:PhnB protein